MYCIDLLEIEKLNYSAPLLSFNRPGLYSFYWEDHCLLKQTKSIRGLNVELNKINESVDDFQSIQLYTNLRTFGYVFNPISIYLCLPKDEKLTPTLIYEVGNTFNEQKYYTFKMTEMNSSQNVKDKYFYVSPFIEHHHQFHFSVKLENDKINITVITKEKDGKPILTATMKGNKVPLTHREMIKATLQAPMITLKVIYLIHWQAFLLFIKGLHYLKKEDHMLFQTQTKMLKSKDNL